MNTRLQKAWLEFATAHDVPANNVHLRAAFFDGAASVLALMAETNDQISLLLETGEEIKVHFQERADARKTGTVKIGCAPTDTLTVKFWRDQAGPLYQGTEPPDWACHIGPDIAAGVGGFGATPLAALRDLCHNIARDEGHHTDTGKLFLR